MTTIQYGKVTDVAIVLILIMRPMSFGRLFGSGTSQQFDISAELANH